MATKKESQHREESTDSNDRALSGKMDGHIDSRSFGRYESRIKHCGEALGRDVVIASRSDVSI